MALVHHHTWLSSRRNSDVMSQLLHRVRHLYQQAFQVLLSWNPKPAAAVSTAGSGGTAVLVLLMALCKNLASVSYEYGDLVQVKVWKSHLEHATHFVDPRLLDRETYNFFSHLYHVERNGTHCRQGSKNNISTATFACNAVMA
jgi:hypothetical protein